jgi:hypothetical protein
VRAKEHEMEVEDLGKVSFTVERWQAMSQAEFDGYVEILRQSAEDTRFKIVCIMDAATNAELSALQGICLEMVKEPGVDGVPAVPYLAGLRVATTVLLERLLTLRRTESLSH